MNEGLRMRFCDPSARITTQAALAEPAMLVEVKTVACIA